MKRVYGFRAVLLAMMLAIAGVSFAQYRAMREKKIPEPQLVEISGAREWVTTSGRRFRVTASVQYFPNLGIDDPKRDSGYFDISEVGGPVSYRVTGAMAFNGAGIAGTEYKAPDKLETLASCVKVVNSRIERDQSGRDIIYTVLVTVTPAGITVDAPGLPDEMLRYTGYGTDTNAFVYFESQTGQRLQFATVSGAPVL